MMKSSSKRPREEESTNRKITLSVKGQDGVSVFFESPRNSPMLKLLQLYCEKRNTEYRFTRFFYNGERITSKNTPDELGMVDNDEIDAMMDQNGGGSVATETTLKYI